MKDKFMRIPELVQKKKFKRNIKRKILSPDPNVYKIEHNEKKRTKMYIRKCINIFLNFYLTYYELVIPDLSL